jgi:hypothetical protein
MVWNITTENTSATGRPARKLKKLRGSQTQTAAMRHGMAKEARLQQAGMLS